MPGECFPILISTYFGQFVICRSEAGHASEADEFYKSAAEHIETYRQFLAHIVHKALGNGNMSNDVLDSLLRRNDILKELLAIIICEKNNDRLGQITAHYNLLGYLGSARLYSLTILQIQGSRVSNNCRAVEGDTTNAEKFLDLAKQVSDQWVAIASAHK